MIRALALAVGPVLALTSVTTAAAIGAAPTAEPGAPYERRALTSLQPVAETHPNFDDEAGGDADADDPALWLDPEHPRRTVILGTLKNGGLDAYDLRGRLLQHVDTPPAPAPDTEAGRFNNVDVLQSTPWGSLAVVTDRGRDRLRAYRISPQGAADDQVLTDLTVPDAPRLFSASEAAVEEQRTAYGLALRSHRGTPYAVVSRRSTSSIGIFRLVSKGAQVSYQRTGALQLPSQFELSDGSTWTPCGEPDEGPQVEGMVVDPSTDVLYAAQEDVGVWRIPMRGAGFGTPKLLDVVREFGRDATYNEETEECEVSEEAHPDSGQHLAADAEGLTLVNQGTRPVQLIVSSQGDNTFARYRLATGGYVGGFRVDDRAATDGRSGIDGAQECDGATLTTVALGKRFPHGLLVVQDGDNGPVSEADGEERPSTNFKLVPWGR